MFKEFTRAHWLSMASVILSFFVLIFGNNFVDKFRRPNVVYSTVNVDLKYPKQGKVPQVPVSPLTPNYYREIRLENTGSKSSTNLRLTIELDGDIIEKDITSDETFTPKYDSSVITLEFNRFVKHATATCKIWLKRNDSKFQLRLIDDDGIKNELSYAGPDQTAYTLVMLIGSVLLTVSVFALCFYMFIRPRNVRISNLETINIELEGKITRLSDELADA